MAAFSLLRRVAPPAPAALPSRADAFAWNAIARALGEPLPLPPVALSELLPPPRDDAGSPTPIHPAIGVLAYG